MFDDEYDYNEDEDVELFDISVGDTVYDAEGEAVYCPKCSNSSGGLEMEWNSDGECECPHCGYVMSRKRYFQSIGIRPSSSKCYSCKGHYPSCRYGCRKI